MARNPIMNRAASLLALALVAVLSCRTAAPPRPYREVPPPDLAATTLDYADSDAFDALLETSLVNQDPVIIVRTGHEKPDWGGRLNAWIAAWNQGGKVAGQTVRGQVPP